MHAYILEMRAILRMKLRCFIFRSMLLWLLICQLWTWVLSCVFVWGFSESYGL